MHTKQLLKQYLILFCSLTLFSCTQKKPLHNTLSDSEKKEGWVVLFDGKTTNGWHLFNHTADTPAFAAVNGELVSDTNEKTGMRGDMVTDKTYENFDLVFEWKIAKEGNSGVFINVTEDTSYMATWATGPEYQLLDNAHVREGYLNDGMRAAGCLYGLAPLQNKVDPKPFGEWNQSRIHQNKGKVSFWLNGVKTADEDFTNAHWKELVASSGFKKFPDFGKATRGHIGLQDWAKGISFRNIKLLQLP